MRRALHVLALVSTAGCGRVAFTPLSTDLDASVDTAGGSIDSGPSVDSSGPAGTPLTFIDLITTTTGISLSSTTVGTMTNGETAGDAIGGGRTIELTLNQAGGAASLAVNSANNSFDWSQSAVSALYAISYANFDGSLPATATVRVRASSDMVSGLALVLTDTSSRSAEALRVIPAGSGDIDIPASEPSFAAIDLAHIATIHVRFTPTGGGNMSVGPFTIVP